MQLQVLALASLLAVAFGQTCIRPGVTIENDQTAKLCFKESQSTTVHLTCNWVDYQFELKVNPDRAQKEIDVVQVAHSGRMNVPLRGSEMPSGRSSCPTEPIDVAPKHFDFISATAPEVRMEVVGGQLYYKTNVTIYQAYYVDDQCNTVRFYDTNIVLSCCADPQSTPPNEITVPLHQYCDLEECKVNPPFVCECLQLENSKDKFTIIAHSQRQPGNLPDNIDYQMAHVTARPHSVTRQVTPLLQLVSNGVLHQSVPDHLQLDHAAGNSGGPTTVHMNAFTFHQQSHAPVAIDCLPEYCIQDPSLPVPPQLAYLPTCAVNRK